MSTRAASFPARAGAGATAGPAKGCGIVSSHPQQALAGSRAGLFRVTYAVTHEASIGAVQPDASEILGGCA